MADSPNRLKAYCRCGATVWEGSAPGFLEEIICARCGEDNSIQPPWFWRAKYGLAQFKKRVRTYGLLKAWRMGIGNALLLTRERERT